MLTIWCAQCVYLLYKTHQKRSNYTFENLEIETIRSKRNLSNKLRNKICQYCFRNKELLFQNSNISFCQNLFCNFETGVGSVFFLLNVKMWSNVCHFCLKFHQIYGVCMSLSLLWKPFKLRILWDLRCYYKHAHI